SNFRTSCRRHPEREGVKRFCLQQLDTGGVLIVNQSIRQNSIVLFDCFLKTSDGEIHGDWGYAGEDKPPWNVGPETSIAFSPSCFFDVPEDFEVPGNAEFRIEFITASGMTFSHDFTQQAPQLRSAKQSVQQLTKESKPLAKPESKTEVESTSDPLPEVTSEAASRPTSQPNSQRAEPAAKQPTRRAA
ncbi:MAG: hypothetical protein ACI9HK_003689, partial [Pirellulaceae bacterium]